MSKGGPLLTEGRITEEGLADLHSKIGVKLRLPPPFNETAVPEAIRKFVDGIGDVNPIYRDANHAQSTKYGGLVAPPSFLYTVYPTLIQLGLPGVHGFHSGNDWEFVKPIFVNDKITAESSVYAVDERKSEFSGKTAIVRFQSRYLRDGMEVARVKAWTVRAERGAARGKGKYSAITLPHPWSEQELRKIEVDMAKESVRGPQLRFWEDTEIGEELPDIIRGPLGMMDMVAFCIGGGFPARIQSYPVAMSYYQRHPGWAHRNPQSMALEPAFMVHFDVAAAQSAGLPYPYDIGTQRNMWLISMLSNWAGDDGFLRNCYAEYRRFLYFSDVVWIRGTVADKFKDEKGEYCVNIETSAINQRGENIMPGKATILLPSRSGYHPLEDKERMQK